MRLLPLVLVVLAALPAAAVAAPVPANAEWTEADFPSADGTPLHADILRPKGLPATAKTPVILSIGPYFNHSGQTGVLGPVQGTDIDPVGPSAGPSDRFYDLLEGGRLMERGYTLVMVDLRGFGGSGGCLDWAGPGEQADVVAAVEWAASQPFSDGNVGMYGKSYDGVTGLIGAALNPKGLKAVVAQEPVYDMYRYLFANGVRFVNSAGTPALYNAIAATPGPLLDDPLYNVNGATTPDCLALNYASQQDSNHDSAYWKARDLIALAPQVKVPLFLTQGFLENNTKPDGTWDFYNAVKGPKRAWFGMWDHVRGNDVDDSGRLLMGRKGFFDETMRFFDHYVRGVPLADAATDKDPANVVQTSDGSYRAESAWPPSDSKLLRTELTPGSYVDDGNNSGTGSGSGNGIWTISAPLAHDAWFSGVSYASLQLSASLPQANVVVNTYDIDADGKAILLSRNTSIVPSDGKVSLDLYGNDWKIPAGHRIGVLVSGSNAEWWLHVPTNQPVELVSGSVDLPFLTHTRPATIQGDPSVRLEEWLEEAPFQIPADVIAASTRADFTLPGALTAAPPTANPPGSTPPSAVPARKRLRVRVARKQRRITVYGTAPAGSRLAIRLRRGKKRTARVRRVTTSVNAFRVRLRVRRPGRYRAVVRTRIDGVKVVRRSRFVRVR